MAKVTLSPEALTEEFHGHTLAFFLKYLSLGTAFGFVLIKSEVVSWYRIQEMFRFQSFHMYGIFATAILTGVLTVWLIKRFKIPSVDGEPITFSQKTPHRYSYLFGGVIFGLGWGLTGVCPGPVLALIGGGFSVVLVILASAVLGTWTYGYLRPRLPH
jgi:uncharacterized membrane protein YedE/YeeE